MKTDQELLELAAKAAGIEGKYSNDIIAECWGSNRPKWGIDKGMWESWNPLTDDGDALRLAIDLELDVMVASVKSVDYFLDLTIEAGADVYAATRRAIVRAAAEIGENMK